MELSRGTQGRPTPDGRRSTTLGAAIVVALIVLLSIASIGRVLVSRAQLSRDESQYAIVSARPQAEDVAIVRGVEGSHRLKYLRHDAPFAKSLTASLGREGTSPLRAFRFKDFVAQEEVPPVQVEGFVESQLRMEADKAFFPWLAVAALLGVAAGLAWASKPEVAPAVLVAGLGIAATKAIAQCATCASASIFGVDVAWLGIALYAVLLGGTLAFRSVAVQRLALIAMGAVTLWQIPAALALHNACLPCSLLAFVASFGVATSTQWEEVSLRLRPSQLPSTVWGLACLPAIVSYFAGGDPLAGIAEGAPGSAAWGTTPQSVENLKDLGLPDLKRRAVVYIGHKGCRPCIDGLAAIDAAGIKGITFASVDREFPDTKRPWLFLPRGESIHQTPTILFAEADGAVKAQMLGGRTDVEGLSAFSQQVQTFFRPAPKGKANP